MRERGFGGVEFLILVAIVGIIAAITIPDQLYSVKRVTDAEPVWSAVDAGYTIYIAEDLSTCRTSGLNVPTGALLKCAWKTAEAAK